MPLGCYQSECKEGRELWKQVEWTGKMVLFVLLRQHTNGLAISGHRSMVQMLSLTQVSEAEGECIFWMPDEVYFSQGKWLLLEILQLICCTATYLSHNNIDLYTNGINRTLNQHVARAAHVRPTIHSQEPELANAPYFWCRFQWVHISDVLVVAMLDAASI